MSANEPKVQLYRIHGRALMTTWSWAGTGLFPKDEAQRYADEMNREQRDLPPSKGPCEYWIELEANHGE